MPASSPYPVVLKRWAEDHSTSALVTQNVGVAFGYIVLAELVLAPSLLGGTRATPVWPAEGLAIVATWFLGLRVLPGIAAAAALVFAVHSGLPMLLAGAASPAGLWAARELLVRAKFEERLARVHDVLALILVAAPAAAAISATVGVTVAAIFSLNSDNGFLGDWVIWLERAWLGIGTTAPLLFAVIQPRVTIAPIRHLVEATVLVVTLLILATVVIFARATPTVDTVVAFGSLPAIAWAALRFGLRGASLTIAAITATVIGIALFDAGPVTFLPLPVAQGTTFVFLLVATVTGLVLAAMRAERDEAFQKRVQLEELLRHSQKMEAVGRLAGGIAHDFNNLLTAILGYAELVIHDTDPKDPRREDVEQIDRAATRAAELTRQMLAFSRRETQQAKVIDLNAVLARVEPMLRRVIGEDVKLTVSAKASRSLVRSDAGQLEQVIMNLAVNARDAMPQGGRLSVETADTVVDERGLPDAQDLPPGPFVQLSVTDTGVGMPPHVRQRMFEPYFTTKPAGRGTGLGLSTVYGIVKQYDGHLTVSSEVGQGTTFRILLPQVEAMPADAEDPTVQKLPGGTEHVLLLEDDGSVRRMTKDLLVRLGYSVTEASSGRAGLALGSDDTRHFDIVICDVILGDMSGPSVAEALQALRPAIRVLYMSGYTDDAIVRTGVLEEGKPFMQKPFTPVQLARKIREVLESREAGAA